ncbi:hypothetical protein NF212_00460 [Parasalinivibrio latis]|uniref:hypothetical protein n=1 Tax=Parasalinivibrio latis TaxID=2952610 RepID=UPI0030E394EE
MKGKRTFLALMAVFGLPVVAAKLVLVNNWYEGGSTNYGMLLEPPLEAQWLAKPGMWRLVYIKPDDCGERCEAALFQLKQIPQAVGPEQDRVISIVLDERSLTANPTSRELAVQPGANETIFLADPMGNVILEYPVPEEEVKQVEQGKGLLKDLKKLMKLSRIG